MIDSTSARSLVLLVLFGAAIQIPFLGQAFHIDDNLYLMVAGNRAVHPWFPLDLPTYFEGLRAEDFGAHSHPLLLSSFLLTPALSTSNPELAAHLIYLPFYLLLIISSYLLACRLVRSPIVAAVLCAISPVVFVSSHTVMLDLPYTALVYGSLALALAEGEKSGQDGHSGLREVCLWLAPGLLLGLACMFAYQALFYAPVICLAARRRNPLRAVEIWAPSLLFLVAYLLANTVHFGRFAQGDLAGFLAQVPPAGGGFKWRITHALLALLAAVVVPPVWLSWFLQARKGWRDSSIVVRCLVFAILINSVCVLALHHVSAVRYWLPAAPALCILSVAALEAVNPKPLRVASLALVLALTALVSAGLAQADAAWAQFYRSVPERLILTQPVRKVWFTGEWGFRWYLERAGARPLGRADNRAQPGDLLVRPRLASPYRTVYDEANALELIQTIPYRPNTPFRLLDFDSHAGFYSFGWGVLPYSLTFDSGPLELIAVYRVTRRVPAPEHEPTFWEWNRPASGR